MLEITDKTGHKEVALDTDLAAQLFQEALDNGKMAYATYPDGTKRQIRKYPEIGTVERVTIIHAHVGG